MVDLSGQSLSWHPKNIPKTLVRLEGMLELVVLSDVNASSMD